MKVKYPQGGEKQLVRALLKREVPKNGLPLDVGVIVHNVGTVFAIYQAIQHDKPLIERVLTVTGKTLENASNDWVKIGTPIKDLVAEVGGLPKGTRKIVNGGPMMGKAIKNLDVPVTKGTSGILVISEGVFGMRGEQGRLKEIVALKQKFNFRLFVDDAHGFGTLGKTGAGAGEEQGVQDAIDVYFATFAKSLASTGAFIAADQEIIDYLKYNLRSQMFAKSLQMQLVVGALKRLDMLRTMPELKQNLWKIVDALQSGLKDRGFDIGTTQSCVTPVYLKGSIPEAMALVRDLRENYGIFCSIVVYHVIPKGLIILRLIPTARHTIEDVNETIIAFSAIREKLENGTYKKVAETMMAE